VQESVLEDLRDLIVDDPRLRHRLLSVRDQSSFIREVVAVADEHGYELSSEEVATALGVARRQSLSRWV
jgi:hypothetical protein